MIHDSKDDASTWPVIDSQSPITPSVSESPLEALSRGDIADIICRQAYTSQACNDVVSTLVQQGLLFDPTQPIPANLQDQAIPENYYYRPGTADEKHDRQAAQPAGRLRIDVGTSLGTRGSEPDSFFEHAGETQQLFASLFAWDRSPVKTIYDQLGLLASEKEVMTAREADGRLYGPAIFRAH